MTTCKQGLQLRALKWDACGNGCGMGEILSLYFFMFQVSLTSTRRTKREKPRSPSAQTPQSHAMQRQRNMCQVISYEWLIYEALLLFSPGFVQYGKNTLWSLRCSTADEPAMLYTSLFAAGCCTQIHLRLKSRH